MTRFLRLRLTDAQVSALECGDWSEEPHLEAAWDRDQWLTWDREQTEGLADNLTAGSNSEDAVAEDRGRVAEERRWARGAARALANLSGKVRLEALKEKPKDRSAPNQNGRYGEHCRAERAWLT